jgi:hypothetical protein
MMDHAGIMTCTVPEQAGALPANLALLCEGDSLEGMNLEMSYEKMQKFIS